jgi:hypothetical protein
VGYTIAGWFVLRLGSTGEEGSIAEENAARAELERRIARMTWAYDTRVEVLHINYTIFLTFHGDQGRDFDTADQVRSVLKDVVELFPGSFGLLYEATERTTNAFRVSVLTRGEIADKSDPFFTPWNPTIDDEPEWLKD